MCFNQTGDFSTRGGSSLKLVDKFTYLGSSVSSTEKDIDTRLTKAWTAIDRLSVIWKSDLTDKMKRSFFQVVVMSILLYGCTTWTITKRMEKKLDKNYTRMLRAILNKFWRQHPIKHQLYGHLAPISKTTQVRRTKHTGHCWRSRNELISDVLLWTPSYGRAKAGRPARTYIQQLGEDAGRSPEDLPEAMNNGEEWHEHRDDISLRGNFRSLATNRERFHAASDFPRHPEAFGSEVPKRGLREVVGVYRSQPCQTNCSFMKDSERLPFTCTTAVENWYRMIIYLQNSGFQKHHQEPMVHPIKLFGLIQNLSARLQ